MTEDRGLAASIAEHARVLVDDVVQLARTIARVILRFPGHP
jgi:hypothetical protein